MLCRRTGCRATVTQATVLSTLRFAATARAVRREAREREMREQFQRDGYVIVPNALDAATVAAMRSGVRKAVDDRATHIQTLPKAMDVFRQQQQKPEPDPLYSKFVRKFHDVMKRKKAERRRKRQERRAATRGESVGDVVSAEEKPATSAPARPAVSRPAPPKLARDATKDDVWAMSQKIAEQLVNVPASQSSIYNDPARLRAINNHRCNAWMTNEKVKGCVFGAAGKVVGRLVEVVAGVQGPMLFADRPLVRDAYQRPTLLHCGAPFIGIDQYVARAGAKQDDAGDDDDVGNGALLACNAWVMLDDCGGLGSALWTVDGSHVTLRRALARGVRTGGVDVRRLHLDFAPMDSDISYWLQRFPELEASGETKEHHVTAGSIVLCDPHLLAATGPNFTRRTHVSIQMHVASRMAKPSVHASSWVKDWKPSSKDVDFSNGVIFPRLDS